jgi:hypothetical protein
VLLKLDGLGGQLHNVEKDVAVVKEDVAGLKEDVTGLKEDVNGMKQNMRKLSREQASISGSQGLITELFVLRRVAKREGKDFARMKQLRTLRDLVSLVYARGDRGGVPTETSLAAMESRLLLALAEEVRGCGACSGGCHAHTFSRVASRATLPVPVDAQHQAFRAWLRVLQERLVKLGVAGAASADTGAALPVASFPAALAALRGAAAAHYFPGGGGGGSATQSRPAADARVSDDDGGDDDDDDDDRSGGGDGGALWWVVACDALAAYAEAVAPASGAATTHAPPAAAPPLPLPAAAQHVLRTHGVSFVSSLALGAQRDMLDIECAGRFRALSAPEAPREGVAAAEMAEIKTSKTGALRPPACVTARRAPYMPDGCCTAGSH